MYVMAMVPLGPAPAGLMDGADASAAQMPNEYTGYQEMASNKHTSVSQYTGMQAPPTAHMSSATPHSSFQGQAADFVMPYANSQAQSFLHAPCTSTPYMAGTLQTPTASCVGGSMQAPTAFYTDGSFQPSTAPYGVGSLQAPAENYTGGCQAKSPWIPSNQIGQTVSSAYTGTGMQSHSFNPSSPSFTPSSPSFNPSSPSFTPRDVIPDTGLETLSSAGQSLSSAPKKHASKALLIRDPKTGQIVSLSASDSAGGSPPVQVPETQSEPSAKQLESSARPVSIRDPRTGAIVVMRAEGTKAFAIRDPRFAVGKNTAPLEKNTALPVTVSAQRPLVKLDKVGQLIQSAMQGNDGIAVATSGKIAFHVRGVKASSHSGKKRWAEDDSESTSSWVSEAVTRSWIGEGSEDTPHTQSPRQSEVKFLPSPQEIECEGCSDSVDLLVSSGTGSRQNVEENDVGNTHEEKTRSLDEESSDGGFIQVKSRKRGGRAKGITAKSANPSLKLQSDESRHVRGTSIEDMTASSQADESRTASFPSNAPAATRTTKPPQAVESGTAPLPSDTSDAAAKPQAGKLRTVFPTCKESNIIECPVATIDQCARPRGAIARTASQEFGDRESLPPSFVGPSLGTPSPSARSSWTSLSRPCSLFPSSEDDLKRQVLSLLNKLCPENLQVIITRIIALGINTSDGLILLLRCIVSKALVDPHYSDVYADVVFSLQSTFPEFPSTNGGKPVTFKPALLNICQAEFESMPKDLRPTTEDLAKCDAEELTLRTKRRKDHILANMRFIGKLFLRKLLPAAVIGSVVKALMLCDKADELPEEHCVECVLELLFSVGLTLEATLVGRQSLALVCGRLADLRLQKVRGSGEVGEQSVFSKRIQFAIQDLLQTRADGWARKTFKSCAKTRDAVRREQWEDETGGKNAACGEYIIAGQRPEIMEEKVPLAQERRKRAELH